MDIKTFLQAYESIVKGEADDAFIDQVFLDVFERIEGSYLEDDFNKAEDRIGKIMAIDKAAHYMHSKDPDILAFAFPEADAVLVKETLDRLSGLEAVSPVRKASRGYFTTFASVEGLTFLQKQVGELKANRATMDEIKADIEEYERLYKAGIVSHAELLVLSRFYGDKGQRYRDELKKGYPGEDPMVVGGYASVEVVDKEGHLITTEALTKAFDKFMKSFRTRNVNFAHCLKPETLIWKVPGGYVPISSIKQGDYVLTDRGRPREVEEVITHDFDSLINVLELANGEIIRVTDEHPILTKRGWVKAKDLTLSDVLLKAVLNGSIETRQKMSEAKKGKRGGWCDPPRGFCVKNDSDLRKGKLWSEVYGHEKPYYGGNDAEKNPNWKGGIARLPYTYEYNAKKQSIFDRDGHRCRLCGKTETQELDELDRLLSVHHIDYIKSHDEDANLVTLCDKCNSKVNFDRDTWKNFFTEMLSGVLVQNGTSIVSISKEPYKGKVWNLHVHEDHTYVGRGIIYHNSDVQAGWPLRVWINQKGEIYKSGVDDKGLYLVSEVRPDITIANKVEKEIEAGVIRSYSIAGSALDKSVETKGNRVIMVVNDLELAEISFCERPVNQESHFDIIKSLPSGKVLGEMLTKQQVLEALPKGELPLSDYTVCLVGRDLVIRADKDSFLGKAIKLALSQELPVGIKDNVKIIFEAEGPHSDYVPLWNIRLGPVSRQEVRLADLSKAGKQLIGMTDADLKKLGEKIGINFDTVSFKEFKMGLQIECEHYDVTEYDPEKTARIVLAHLRELPDYYTKLKGMENPQPTMPESIPEMGKGKVVDNEVGMKRPEDQNDIDVKKESSGLKDKSGSNEQVKQSPNVQTPVTKVGEVHCAETMKKGLKGLQEYVSKAQPPAMAPPRPGLIWDPIGHRWKKPQIGAGSDEYSWAQFEAGGKMYRVGHSAKSDQYIVDVNDGSRWHSIASGLKSSREAMDKIKQLSGTEPVAKSSTTRITSPALHPSLAIRHPKIRWGEPEKPVAKKSMTQSGMAGMAAFLDFIQDAENKSK